MRGRPSLLRDERGIVASFLLKLVLGIAIVGLVVIDGTSVVVNRVQTDDIAEAVANDAADEWNHTHNLARARNRANLTISEKDPHARLRSIEVRPDGVSVRVTVSKRANTLVIDHIGFLEDLGVSRVTAVGRPPLL